MAITVEDLGTNLITLEARFTGLEERYTRIETGLTQLLNKSSDLAHDIELRV
jgi:hypothetical protein